MEIRKEDLSRWAGTVQGELSVLRDSLRDKGVKYFARAFGLGGLLIFMAYHYVHLPVLAAMASVASELEAVRATGQYAGDYKDLQARLEGFYTRLPRTRDPQSWLLSEVRESLRQEGIVPNNFSTPTEEAGIGYRVVSIQVGMNASYGSIASWIARLERSKSLLHVQELTLVKNARPIGQNTATVTVATVVPDVAEAP